MELGTSSQKIVRKNYFAYKRLKNFACVEVHPHKGGYLLVYLKVNPDTMHLEQGFSRDVRQIGHFGTGDLELRIATAEQLDAADALIKQSYDAS